MHDVFLSEVAAGKTYLIGNLRPIYTRVPIKERLQAATLAVLSDDVVVVTSEVKIHEFGDVWMFHFFQNLYFAFQHLPPVLLHIAHFHNF